MLYEALDGKGDMSPAFSKHVLSENSDNTRNANSQELPGIAWALSKSDKTHLDQLIAKLRGTEFRQWIAYIIGMQGEERYVSEIEKLKDLDSEVYFAATLLWKIITSWVYELKEY